MLHKTKNKRFSEETARLYAAEVLISIETLHMRNIIYRDLKLENILIDETGHCVLSDFGLSKEGVIDGSTTKSFCGSVAYLAPEVLRKKGHTKSVDWYNFGTFIYEMLESHPPFYAENKSEIYKNILISTLKFGSKLSANAINLLTGLLQKDPAKRMSSSKEIRSHPWFSKICWTDVENRTLKMPLPTMTVIKECLPKEPFQLDMVGDVDTNNILNWTFMRSDDIKKL
jgi:serine/threonine protein kinase